MSLLDEYVERFNAGVPGEWIRCGPLAGREAIGEAYRSQPPDDELVLLEPRGESGAVYAWAGKPTGPAGELHLELRDGSIARVRVLYERLSC